MIIHNGFLSFALYDIKKNNITLCEYQELPLPDGIFYQGIMYNLTLLQQYIRNFTNNIQHIEGILYVCDVEMKKNQPISYYATCIQFLILSYACGISFLTVIPIKKINKKHTTLQHLSCEAIEYAIKEL